MKTLDRALAPTPDYFRNLRNAGLLILVITWFMLAIRPVLPDISSTMACYAGFGAMILAGVSQLPVQNMDPLRSRLFPDDDDKSDY